MAVLSFTVLGAGGTPVVLPVTVNPPQALLNGLEVKSLAVDITNPLTRDVAFTQVTVTVGGTAAAKVNATIRFDNFVIPAGGVFNNFLDVESQEAVYEEETFDILVEATEAVA